MKFKSLFFTSIVLGLVLCFSSLVLAGGPKKTQDSNFQNFAKRWVKKLNLNHINGITRVKIIKNPDGSYMARYHYIDPASISCSVKNSKSRRNRQVGLLKYVENVYECSAPSEKQARKGKFKVSKAMRVTEIFSSNGRDWR